MQPMNLNVKNSENYQLLDSGDGRKLEMFGQHILDRPCPQAIWPQNPTSPWGEASAAFSRGTGGSGDWETEKGISDNWPITLEKLNLEMRLTGFGNVGLFPEHSCHWDWISDLLASRKAGARVLNLFAYTGGASIVCSKVNAKVTHVDAAKSVNAWAILNAQSSGVPKENIRFLADDASKFVKRELRRSNRYDAIILDPPTFGRGTKGEVWKVERDLNELIDACFDLLSNRPLFMLVTSHSPGITPTVLENLLRKKNGDIESGEMLISGDGPPLPAGCFAKILPGK